MYWCVNTFKSIQFHDLYCKREVHSDNTFLSFSISVCLSVCLCYLFFFLCFCLSVCLSFVPLDSTALECHHWQCGPCQCLVEGQCWPWSFRPQRTDRASPLLWIQPGILPLCHPLWLLCLHLVLPGDPQLWGWVWDAAGMPQIVQYAYRHASHCVFGLVRWH